MCREGFLIGGFASITFYYKPLQWWLAREGFSVEFIRPGPLTLNVWPLDRFFEIARPVLEKAPDPVFIIGHSLGGIQAIMLADMFPKVKKVFTVGTPVWGCSVKMYEDAIRALLIVPDELWDRFHNEIIPRQANKIVTISCKDDLLAPQEKCVIEGALANYVLQTDEVGASSSHLLLPYLTSTVKIITDEIKAIPVEDTPLVLQPA